MKSVLVLGAGLVTKPLVQYLLKYNFKVRVASRTVSKAEKLIDGHSNGEAIQWTVDREDELKRMIGDSDLTISLLPAAHHPVVAEMCIQLGKDMATTSYVGPAMKALDEPAKRAGVVILNESGVDPGIDHMSAMRIIHAVQKKGGKVVSFMSYCGGLPASEANTNPYGYKFSWSPKGVLLAGKNDGRYRKDGEEISVPGEELFSHYWHIDIPTIGELEAYPNRDSLGYIELYGLTGIPTMYRGTLRYKGWCDTLKATADIGYFDDAEKDWRGKTFADLGWELVGKPPSGDLRAAFADKLNIAADSFILDRFDWLGFFSDEAIAIDEGGTIDVLTARMLEKMPYGPGERDMIALYHNFLAEYPDGRKEEITSTLIDYGIPDGDSSMSRTVSLPAAVGARLILDGKFKQPGVWVPVIPELYNPVLDELETLGIKCEEASKAL
ncbi:saccharopine dehydrogenase [candidate division LCP-89 bacterium B3_LCP]|uniref:Saccharopine dehydrogenase n=1 Tax=candidate division LCP-89 bacterium B3_LCP TaxID=2012998 RepID=A0A532V252_UNCL8|nr:MAG: saccharopine dehydrogenase [candidate division LCP-89 bacterium B3_LCP]